MLVLRLGRRGFTLIELLIVVAIIAILAAIAVPNFLEAQVRSKVSRAKADQRSVAIALDAYYVDSNSYPATYWNDGRNQYLAFCRLSTPVAFITSIPVDAFNTERRDNEYEKFFEYGSGRAGKYASQPSLTATADQMRYPNDAWMINSVGPDKTDDTTYDFMTIAYPWVNLQNTAANATHLVDIIYDPTNGTVSTGEIFRAGGVPPGPVAQMWFNLIKR